MLDEVRPATEADIKHISENLKEDDRAELSAAGYEPSAIIPLSHVSKVLAWGPEGAPMVIFGVHREGRGVGRIWSLSTPEILPRWRTVHRASPALVQELGRGYDILTNLKDARHEHHIRWLRSLGFVFINTLIVGPDKRLFHEFVRIQK